MQTFEVESHMYTVELVGGQGQCTVFLKKSKIEVNGENKLIIMLIDVSDRVRLEQEQE
jgi:hypothetical protein